MLAAEPFPAPESRFMDESPIQPSEKRLTVTRRTRQRTAILQAFRQASRPLTVEEVWHLGKALTPRLGLRTVYRNINEMLVEGALTGVDYPGQPVRYELVAGEHRPHLICRDCNKIFVIPEASPDFEYPSPEGFEVTGSEIILFARCTRQSCPERSSPKPNGDDPGAFHSSDRAESP